MYLSMLKQEMASMQTDPLSSTAIMLIQAVMEKRYYVQWLH